MLLRACLLQKMIPEKWRMLNLLEGNTEERNRSHRQVHQVIPLLTTITGLEEVEIVRISDKIGNSWWNLDQREVQRSPKHLLTTCFFDMPYVQL